MVLLLSMGLLGSANAAMVDVEICAKYQVAFDDSDLGSGEDYYATNSDKVARGAAIRARPSDNSGDVIEFAEWDDGQALGPGCVELELDTNKVYALHIMSKARVRGNHIKVRKADTGNVFWFSVGEPAYTPVANDVVPIETANSHKAWNIASVMAHALYRRDGGVDHIYSAFTNQTCGGNGTSCFSPTKDGLYLSPDDRNSRVVIAHELGHYLGAVREKGPLGTLQSPNSDYHADEDGCATDPGVAADLHDLNSKEHQSAAFSEGWAHFYAAVAFNSTVQNDCGFVYYRASDYDLDTFIEAPKYHVMSCELGPSTVGVDPKDYYHDWCNPLGGVHENRGTSLDWLRFWWNFMSEEPDISFADCIDILDDADPRNWNSKKNLPDPDNVYERMEQAAHVHLLLRPLPIAIWDDHIDQGILR